MGPGIFILLSGFTLTLSLLNKDEKKINIREFYVKRLTRIFPLYLTIHLLVILVAVLLNESIGFDASKVSLSMLGLRFTDGLFFYINPSWWFIWLILQLYFVFPFLYRLLEKRGIKVFLAITIGITILSRIAGLMGITYSERLEYWMTGIFAGTRLSEFALGMVLAKLIAEKRFDPLKVKTGTLFFTSFFLYITGFICSLFYASTILSNTFITIGLAGVFLSVSKMIEFRIPSISNAIKWTGVISFPLFLLHQPLMSWIGNDFSGVYKGSVQIILLLLVFPASWFIEQAVNRMTGQIQRINGKYLVALFSITIALQIILNITYFAKGNELLYKADVILLIVNVFLIPLCLYFRSERKDKYPKQYLISFLSASVIFSLILTKNWFAIFWIFVLVLFTVQYIISRVIKDRSLSLLSAFLILFFILPVIEIHLMRHHPVEVNTWGELPALQKDDETIYSLIPDRETHLRYNNYDYLVKTNSLGFNGPDVIIGGKDSNDIRILVIGDAFTMPEGMEYEKAYPELLQAYLNENLPGKRIVVFNGGVTGYGPNEMYACLSKYIDTLKPDICINQVFINEFEEINLDKKQRLNSIGLNNRTFRESIFAGNQTPQHIKAGFHRLLKDDSHKRNAYNKSLLQFYESDSDFYLPENVFRVKDYIVKAKSLCESRACTYAILYAPGQMEVSQPEMISYYPWHIPVNDTLKFNFELPLKIYRDLCSEADVVFIDPTVILKTHPKQPVYFTRSWHWNEEGHKVIAGFLGDRIYKILER